MTMKEVLQSYREASLAVLIGELIIGGIIMFFQNKPEYLDITNVGFVAFLFVFALYAFLTVFFLMFTQKYFLRCKR